MMISYPFINITDVIAKCINIQKKKNKIKFELIPNTKNILEIWFDKSLSKYYYSFTFDKNVTLKWKIVWRDTKDMLWESLEKNITKILAYFKRNNLYNPTINYNKIDDFSLKSIFDNLDEINDFPLEKKEEEPKIYSEKKKIGMEYLYDIGLWFKDLREDIKISKNLIIIHLKDILKVPIVSNIKFSNIPNKFFSVLHYFKIEAKVEYNEHNILVISEGYSSSEKITLLRKNYYNTYVYTQDEKFKAITKKLLNISDNSLFNFKKWMTNDDFELKSECPKCKNVWNTFEIICFNSELLIDVGKNVELNITKENITDFWEYGIISCWNCGYKFLENRYPLEIITTYSFEWTSSFSCDNCKYYDNPILIWDKKKIYVTYDWIKYSVTFMNSQISEVKVLEAGNMISYKCFNCNEKYFL